MSRDRLPPVPGWAPTKVVFDGVKPGSPEAQALYLEFQGPINRFHAKARQAVQTSEQQGFGMHQKLPNGGMMRYSFNHGQETIHVQVEPEIVVVAKKPKKPKPKPKPKFLAIDVLIDARVYHYEFREDIEASGEIINSFDFSYNVWASTFMIGVRQVKSNGEILHQAHNGLAFTEAGLPTQFGGSKVGDKLYSVASGIYAELLPDLVPMKGGRIDAPSRVIPYAPDGLSSGTSGAGFVANVQGLEQARFDIYMASQNPKLSGVVTEHIVGAELEYSDPPTAETETRYRLQVREYDGDNLAAISAPTATQFEQVVDDLPPEMFDQIFNWGFAATKNWSPVEVERADPKNPGMGVLVKATETRTVTVNAAAAWASSNDILESPFGFAVNAAGEDFSQVLTIDDLTKIATIVWTASDDPDKPGIATITPLV